MCQKPNQTKPTKNPEENITQKNEHATNAIP